MDGRLVGDGGLDNVDGSRVLVVEVTVSSASEAPEPDNQGQEEHGSSSVVVPGSGGGSIVSHITLCSDTVDVLHSGAASVGSLAWEVVISTEGRVGHSNRDGVINSADIVTSSSIIVTTIVSSIVVIRVTASRGISTVAGRSVVRGGSGSGGGRSVVAA